MTMNNHSIQYITDKLADTARKWNIKDREEGRRNTFISLRNCIWSQGITTEHNPCFYLEAGEPFNVGSSLYGSIRCKETHIEDDWIFMIELTNLEESNVYLKLIEDLIIQSVKYEEDPLCVQVVIKRFKQWASMLQHRSDFDPREQGLFGELLVLQEIMKVLPPLEAVTHWMGPKYEKQDFKFADTWIEVKTTNSNSSSVKISSLAQLTSTDTGYLYVVLADKSNSDPEALSVQELYDDIYNTLERTCPEACDTLKDKLVDFSDFRLCMEGNRKFLYRGRKIYRVEDEFPRLTTDNDHPAFKAVNYDLLLDALGEWEIKDNE